MYAIYSTYKDQFLYRRDEALEIRFRPAKIYEKWKIMLFPTAVMAWDFLEEEKLSAFEGMPQLIGRDASTDYSLYIVLEKEGLALKVKPLIPMGDDGDISEDTIIVGLDELEFNF